jgi:hypothetical protein
MGFVRKLTGVQKQIDATNRNADAQIKAAKMAADSQVAALNAGAKAVADNQRLAADRARVEQTASEAANIPMGVADVALDAGATESVGVARRKVRAQFGKGSYSAGVGI